MRSAFSWLLFSLLASCAPGPEFPENKPISGRHGNGNGNVSFADTVQWGADSKSAGWEERLAYHMAKGESGKVDTLLNSAGLEADPESREQVMYWSYLWSSLKAESPEGAAEPWLTGNPKWKEGGHRIQAVLFRRFAQELESARLELARRHRVAEGLRVRVDSLEQEKKKYERLIRELESLPQ